MLRIWLLQIGLGLNLSTKWIEFFTKSILGVQTLLLILPLIYSGSEYRKAKESLIKYIENVTAPELNVFLRSFCTEYVSALDQRYSDLKKSIHVPAKEKLIEYGQKVDFIKGLLKAYKLNGALEKAECSQLLASSSVPTLPDSKTEIGKTTTKRLHLQATSHYTNEMRKELLGDNIEDGTIQESGLAVKVNGTEDLDEFLQQHQNKQEKLAENMISLVRRLKNTTSAAGDIIKKDNERLDSALRQADTNTLQLKVQSARMEKHSKKSCNWWMWGMLALVFIVYLWMIMFIKMFPKK